MDEIERLRIERLLNDEDFMREVFRKLEEEESKAKKCNCGYRCEAPFGNNHQCFVCASMPTARDYGIIIY